MNGRFLANMIALFVPNRNLRHRLRNWKGFESRQDRLEKEIAYLTRLVMFLQSPSNIRPAQGLMRGVQYIMLEQMKHLATLFDANGIEYWLDFGTLLGAVRHKGFVPWDEDMDIAVRMQDRSRVVELLRKENINFDTHDYPNGLLRVIIYKTPTYVVHIDIMCYAQVELTQEKICLANDLLTKANKKYARYSEKYHKEVISALSDLQDNSAGTQTVYARCVDVCLKYPTYIVEHKTLFPLTTLDFEGTPFKVPAMFEEYLTALYKDYMQWPPSLHTNDIISRLSMDERIELIQSIKQLPEPSASCLKV